LDREEMDAMSANLFRANDLNHDGYVTREEMERLGGRH
jgi:Ca2+-binding EF-hand superfamily protein